MFGNYQKCSLCGKFADDGGLYKGKFTCHDCLDHKCADKDKGDKHGD